MSLRVSFPPFQPTLSHFIYSIHNMLSVSLPVCTGVCIYFHKKARGQDCVSSSIAFSSLFLVQDLSWNTELAGCLCWLDSKPQDPSASTSPVAGITDGVCSSDLFMWCWRFELRFSRLRGKHFTNGAIFPALSFVP